MGIEKKFTHSEENYHLSFASFLILDQNFHSLRKIVSKNCRNMNERTSEGRLLDILGCIF
jgi:hypothetical protein